MEGRVRRNICGGCEKTVAGKFADVFLRTRRKKVVLEGELRLISYRSVSLYLVTLTFFSVKEQYFC